MTMEFGAQYSELDTQGPKPVFDEFVFKLSSDCNMRPPSASELSTRQLPIALENGVLGCDQCYEYVNNDEWRHQPALMPMEVIEQAATRIAEHAQTHGLADIRIIAHGGEPLMGGARYLDTFATRVREIIQTDDCTVHLFIQTNGLLLTSTSIDVLKKHQVTVGLSLDGNIEANDRHRRDKLGRSTYDRVAKAARLLAEHDMKWGFLTVIDTANNPEDTLETLAAFGPDTIDMFPAHSNWSSPKQTSPDNLPLGDWQIRVFERWRCWQEFHPGQSRPSLPLVEGYIDAFLGAKPVHERIGNRYPQELFFLPNGDMQRLDTLKSTEIGAFRMDHNVFDHGLDEVSQHDPGFIARRMGKAALAEQCLACPFLETCGGDYYPLRFKQNEKPLDATSGVKEFAEAFRHPSVNCEHQITYLRHIAMFIRRTKAAMADAPIGIYRSWSNSAYAIETHPPKEIASLVAAMDASSNPYTMFPSPSTRQPVPVVGEYQIEPLLDFIASGKYPARLALHALKEAVSQHCFGNRLYMNPSTHRQEMNDYSRTADTITQDIDNAIVRALFHPDHVFLKGLEYRLRQADGYWFVTREAVQAHTLYSGLPGNGYISTMDLDQRNAWEVEYGCSSFKIEAFIGNLVVSPGIAVNIADAPADLLVISGADNTSGSSVEAFDFVMRELHKYNNRPWKMAHRLAEEGSPIKIAPLGIFWLHPGRLEVLKREYVASDSPYARDELIDNRWD